MIARRASKVAVVTGAGSGIGRAVALRMAAAGWSLALVGRDAAKLANVSREVASNGGEPLSVPTDVTDAAAGDTLRHAVQSRFGGLDALVHSAGVFEQGSIAGTTAELTRAVIETNTVGPYAVTRALLPMLIEHRGQVVFMNSSVVGNRRGGIAAYAASKAALAAFTDALREEVNPCGVRVLSVFLGRTATPMQERIFAMEGRAYAPEVLLQADDVATIVMSALELPRTAEVTDLHVRPMSNPRAGSRAAPSRVQPTE